MDIRMGNSARRALAVGWFVALAVIAATSTVALRSAPGESSPVEASYLRARSVLDAGVKALGKVPNDVTFHIGGKLYMRQQSPSSSETVNTPLTGNLELDMAGSRVAWDVQASFPGGFRVDQGIRIVGDKNTFLNHQLKTSFPAPGPAANALEIFQNRIPHSLLARADQRAATLRWIGEADFRGRRHNVISFATVNGTQIALWFDAQTNILSKSEQLISDPYLGDAVNEFIIKGWQTIGEYKFPTGQVLVTGGEMAQDFDYSDVRLNAKPAEAAFAIPQGYEAQPLPNVPLNVHKLADDVYLIEGMGPQGAYSSLAVAFNDYVLVVEAPIGDAVVKTLLEKVRETIPGKPIRYVALTHHHSDHAGGIRTVIAEGITVVTTPGNVRYFETTAGRRFTLPPDELQLKSAKPKFETVTGHKRAFTDGAHTVELIDIGPSPHANEMLIVWLPKERILFEGDQFFKNPDNSTAPAVATTFHFVNTLAKLGIDPQTFVGVHQRVYSRQDLQASLDLARKNGTAVGQ